MMTKEDMLVEAMIKAIASHSDEEANEAHKLSLEIARNMKLGEVRECQRQALELVKERYMLDEIMSRSINKQSIH